jgi:hypothetical protein
MPGDHPLATAVGDVPDPGRPVGATRGQPPAVRREDEGVDHVGMTPEDPLDDAGAEVDEADLAPLVFLQPIPSHGQGPPVRRQRGGEEHPLRTPTDRRAQHPQRFAAGHIPDADRLVVRDRDQLTAIGREQDFPDDGGVAAGVEDQDRLTLFRPIVGPGGGTRREAEQQA